MTDLIDIPDPKSPRRNIQREHIFQAIVDRFLDRIVLQPFWTTGINHENELTDNARSRARGRGVKGGVPDVYIAQIPGRSAWIELKWGSNQLSGPQTDVRRQLTACGIPIFSAWSMDDVLAALLTADFSLHGNAVNLATEYQARAEAAIAKAEAKAATPYRPGKPRVVKPTAARTRRVEGVRGRTMF